MSFIWKLSYSPHSSLNFLSIFTIHYVLPQRNCSWYSSSGYTCFLSGIKRLSVSFSNSFLNVLDHCWAGRCSFQFTPKFCSHSTNLEPIIFIYLEILFSCAIPSTYQHWIPPSFLSPGHSVQWDPLQLLAVSSWLSGISLYYQDIVSLFYSSSCSGHSAKLHP